MLIVITDKTLAATFLTWAASKNIPAAKEHILQIIDKECPIALSNVGEVDGWLESRDYAEVQRVLSNL